MKGCPRCNMRYSDEATYCFVDGSDLNVLPDPRLGALLADRYRLEAAIGEGGMATVYRARDTRTGELFAIKILSPLVASDPIVRERFRREARSAKKLAHPNIIEIFDEGATEDETAYVVMELLEGASLAQTIRRGPLETHRAIDVMIQIVCGIARAHDLEIIHRDIKPENIFLGRRDDGSDLVKVLDFGIAKSRQDSRLTGQGELFGTPQYMAPERILGKETGKASDIYALGVVFFELLTGELPFHAPDVATFFIKHMEQAPPPVRSINRRVPERLDNLVLRMLAKSPLDRPVDVHRIHRDLLALIHDGDAVAPRSEVGVSSKPRTRAARSSDPWARRMIVLEQMLERAFGSKSNAPGELAGLLAHANDLVRRLETLRLESLKTQETMDAITANGRERRAQLGSAVDQLGVDASKAREQLQHALETVTRRRDAATNARAEFEAARTEALLCDQHRGGLAPSADLARAFRVTADAIDELTDAGERVQRAEQAADAANRCAVDLDFQLGELRGALTAHEQELDEARSPCESLLRAQGKEADQLESTLLEITTRFCQPLRLRPELAPLFEELKAAAAA